LDSLELIANKQAFKQNAAESQTFIENQNNQKNQEFQENLDFEENQEFQEELEDFEENLFNNDDKLPKKLESILSEVVQNAQEESSAGGVSECIAEIPQIIENYKKEKVIKEKVKNFFYDEAIELNEIEESKEEKNFGFKKFLEKYKFRFFGNFFW